jgi:anti-sigma factor RsiW
MNVDCKDRERIFEDGSATEWAALEAHAETCVECAEEVRAWKAISAAAQELRDDSESPALWARIERGLDAQAREQAQRRGLWSWLSRWTAIPVVWQVAAAGAMVLLLTVSAAWIYRGREAKRDRGDSNARLLKNPQVAEVERAEAAYMQAIDKLAAEAEPELAESATPLLASYKEKLLVLDSAIEDLRLQAGLNPSNAHVRQQLLAMYQEKQHTLQEILETKQ